MITIEDVLECYQNGDITDAEALGVLLREGLFIQFAHLRTSKCHALLRELLDTVKVAIRTGDWKVDGACDPDATIRRAEEYLSQVCPSMPQCGAINNT